MKISQWLKDRRIIHYAEWGSGRGVMPMIQIWRMWPSEEWGENPFQKNIQEYEEAKRRQGKFFPAKNNE